MRTVALARSCCWTNWVGPRRSLLSAIGDSVLETMCRLPPCHSGRICGGLQASREWFNPWHWGYPPPQSSINSAIAPAVVSLRESARSICRRGQKFIPSHLAGKQAAYGHAEHLSQKHELEVGDPADTQLDAGNDVAGNIPACQLTLCRQHGLRPSSAGAEHANLRADNVTGFLGGVGHVVWISTLDLTRLSQSYRVVFRTIGGACAGRFSVQPTLRLRRYVFVTLRSLLHET